jgi:S1-C subfamily serine protease
MIMMTTGWARILMVGLLMAGTTPLAAPASIGAQERAIECRCVDRDGREIENCTCLRMPDVERVVMDAWAFRGSRPRLGLSVEMSDPGEQADGARISGLLEDGPAARAGLREGDVVTHIDGRALAAPLEAERERGLDADRALPPQRLLEIVRDIEPGQEVEIEYLRDGRADRVTVEAEELSDWGRSFTVHAPDWDAERFGERMRELGDRMRSFRGPRPPDAPTPPGAFRFRFDGPGPDGLRGLVMRGTFGSGLEMVRVGPELGSYFGTERGVLVTAVPEDSALGLQVGDVILEIGDRTVEDPARVRSILATYDADEPVTFRIRRDGREMDVSGRIGRPDGS